MRLQIGFSLGVMPFKFQALEYYGLPVLGMLDSLDR